MFLHPSERTHCVAFIIQNYFDWYGCSLPQKLSKFTVKQSGYCFYSQYKKQDLTIKKKFLLCSLFFICNVLDNSCRNRN